MRFKVALWWQVIVEDAFSNKYACAAVTDQTEKKEGK
jgi:hypothetical protein